MLTAKKKLISLNLAVVLMFLAAFPAVAVETERTDPEGLREARLVQQLERLEAEGGEEQAELSAETPFRLQVGTTVFKSDQDRSGAGWAYTAADHRLTLEGYQGGGIAASGDLVIYTYGENQVTGQNGTYYGQDGIVVDGDLEIDVEKDSTLWVTGGNGHDKAGQGISADGDLTCWLTGSLYAKGGEATASNAYGGDALSSLADVSLYGHGDQATVTALGGQAKNGLGGYGIFASYVSVYANCEIVGASGLYGGVGISFSGYCFLGVIDGVICGGEASSSSLYDGVPIRSGENGTQYHNKHTTLRESGRRLTITVKEYTLRIDGNGGQHDGKLEFSDTQKYPARYPLTDYLFQLDKYTQVGWQEWSGDFVALNAFYTPEADTRLTAQWLMVDPGDIVINSLDRTLDDGSHYRSQRTALTLPTQLQGAFGSADVLGWSSTVDAEPDPSTQVMRGVWYEGGDVVQPDKNSVQLLYSRSAVGKYVRYHPTDGSVKNGGTILVQGTTATVGDLEVYAIDGSAMTPPQGCALRGWSRAADVDAVRYQVGERISLPAYPASQTLDLYAVWEQVEFVETLEPGVQVCSNTDNGNVTVELTQEWCQDKGAQTVIAAGFTSGGRAKLLDAAVASCGTGDVRLTFAGSPQEPNQVKLFVLDHDLAPICPYLDTVVFSSQN